jgi:signal peptidase I
MYIQFYRKDIMSFLNKIKDNDKTKGLKESIKNGIKTFKDNKGFFGLLILIVTVKSSIVDWNYVPTGSMRPTLADGDQIIINKLAYDVTIPLTYKSLYKISDPKKGDIVVFDTEKQDVRMVKRVLAVPGDKIKIRKNKVYINDQKLEYSEDFNSEFLESVFKPLDESDKENYKENNLPIDKMAVTYQTETLNGVKHGIRLEEGVQKIGSLGLKEMTIPENNYLMIGDNRNNSLDSRYWGLVERHEIVGKVNYVVFSLDQDHWLKPRMDRLFTRVD